MCCILVGRGSTRLKEASHEAQGPIMARVDWGLSLTKISS